MPVKLNVNRTQVIEVPVPDQGLFSVTMRIPKSNEPDVKVVDLIESVQELDLVSEDFEILAGEELVETVRNDSQLAALVLNAWNLGNQSLLKKQRTLIEPLES